jgi:hypothetical protein
MGGSSTHMHNGENYPEYCMPDENTLKNDLGNFRKMLKLFCDVGKLDIARFSVDDELVLQSFIKVDHRILHYKMYHQGTKINELKQVALLAYWILKYKPLVYDNGKCRTTQKYNEVFALYCIMCIVKMVNSSCKFGKDVINDLIYTFTHRITTFDSMTLLVEALVM